MRQGRLSLLTGAGGIMGRLTLPSIVQYEYGAWNPWMLAVRNIQGRRVPAPWAEMMRPVMWCLQVMP